MKEYTTKEAYSRATVLCSKSEYVGAGLVVDFVANKTGFLGMKDVLCF